MAKSTSNFPALLQQFQGEIERALPKHLSGDRMTRIALTAFRRSPKLAQCDPRSVFAAVIQASQLGLEPDTLGRAYLIPYGKECQFIPGWKGLVDLCNRTEKATVWTGAVFVGDEFDYALGSAPFATHKPKGESRPDKLLHVYACGKVKGADQAVIEVWPIDRVWRHRDKYNKVGKGHYSFKNEEMYARKVVLLQVLKYMPASTELATAISLNDAAEMGKQRITIDDAISGTWEQVPNDESSNQPAAGIKQPQSKSAQDKPKFSCSDIIGLIEQSKTQDDIDMALDIVDGLTDTEKKQVNDAAVTKSKTIVAQ